MHVRVSCKKEEGSIKNEGARVFRTFLQLKMWGDFFRRSRVTNSAVQCPIRMYLEISLDFTADLLACKNEEDSIKNEGAGVFSTLNIDFSDAQRQLTS